jgi:hypothetical protein
MGFGWLTCLRFDEACLSFVDEWERRRDATKQVPAPSGKRKPTIAAPEHSPAQLLRWLGIDPDDMPDAGERYVDPQVEAMAADILAGRAEWLME